MQGAIPPVFAVGPFVDAWSNDDIVAQLPDDLPDQARLITMLLDTLRLCSGSAVTVGPWAPSRTAGVPVPAERP